MQLDFSLGQIQLLVDDSVEPSLHVSVVVHSAFGLNSGNCHCYYSLHVNYYLNDESLQLLCNAPHIDTKLNTFFLFFFVLEFKTLVFQGKLNLIKHLIISQDVHIVDNLLIEVLVTLFFY